jgi:4a-hydroxytetrahydrobiopterin dehydratase
MPKENLTKKHCVPCERGASPMGKSEAERYLARVPGWKLAENGRAIERAFSLPDFKSALAFANRIGDIAEAENHHPELTLSWGEVRVSLTTHAIGGLSENDFILAAKIQQLSLPGQKV